MQDIPMSRWLSPLMAFCLSFVLITTLAPVADIQRDRQLDFWALWLLAMFILALPLIYLETALLKRSKTTALNALMSLTREADVSPRWRVVGWLAVIFVPYLAGAMIANTLHQSEQWINQFAVPMQWLIAALVVVAVILSLLPRLILIVLMTVAVITSFVLSHVFALNLAVWHVTPVTFAEWGHATVLALVASGLGLGIYAQSNAEQLRHAEYTTSTAVPVWVAQLLAVLCFGFFAVQTQIPALTITIAAVFAAALLLQLAREQLAQRQINIVLQWLIVIVVAMLWVASTLFPLLNFGLMLWGLIVCLIYAIFVGWKMKISHLRKALNFQSEAIYNVWRIAVRVILPISIVAAIVAVIIGQV
ncbi:MAG: hypothetical protein QM666_01895 [Acinetobacter sp.]